MAYFRSDDLANAIGSLCVSPLNTEDMFLNEPNYGQHHENTQMDYFLQNMQVDPHQQHQQQQQHGQQQQPHHHHNIIVEQQQQQQQFNPIVQQQQYHHHQQTNLKEQFEHKLTVLRSLGDYVDDVLLTKYKNVVTMLLKEENPYKEQIRTSMGL